MLYQHRTKKCIIRSLLVTCALSILFSYTKAQDRFVHADYNGYFEWFHQRAQSTRLYEKGSQLFVFGHDVHVYEGPCEQAAKVAKLQMGQSVRNLVSYVEELYVPEDEINGYGDIWYQVGGTDQHGQTFSGYLWGGHIAKAWTMHDFTGDRQKELIMLGVSPAPRRSMQDIGAEIRVLHNGHLLYQKQIAGLCVFEDCGSDVLLRILPDQPTTGDFMLEASTMTISCFAGIEKAFFHWDGQRLQLIYHAEFTSRQQFSNQSFTSKAADGSVQVCRYSHEDQAFNPVWSCKEIPTAGSMEDVSHKGVPVARAR